MTRALFLDRDGIVNIDKTYIYKYEDIEWVPGIFELIRFANTHGYLVIVLTNQSGVAQGMYKEEDVKILHEKMSDFLKSQGLKIDDWFYCPDYSNERRKPAPGMMIEAKNKYGIDLSKSVMVGDKPSDVLNIEGPRTFLLKGNYPLEEIENNKRATIVTSLAQVTSLLEDNLHG